MRKPLTALGKHQELGWRGWLGGVGGGEGGGGGIQPSRDTGSDCTEVAEVMIRFWSQRMLL